MELLMKIVFLISIFLSLLALAWIQKTTNMNQPKFKPAYRVDNTQEAITNETTCNKRLNSPSPPFGQILLAINFNHPHYSNIPILEEYYKPIFSRYIYCGPELDRSGRYNIILIKQLRLEYGFYGYQCLVEAILQNPDHEGYLLINDDMIFNWWNFLELNKSRIWFGDDPLDLSKGHKVGSKPDAWFESWGRGARCSKMYIAMENRSILNETGMLEMYELNTDRRRICIAALSDIFYIPGRLANNYALIGDEFYRRRMFLEIAVPMSIYSLDDLSDVIWLNGKYLQKKYGWGGTWKQKSATAWKEYDYKIHFLHPYKFNGDNTEKHTAEFKDYVEKISERILREKCLDLFTQKTNFSTEDRTSRPKMTFDYIDDVLMTNDQHVQDRNELKARR